MTEITRARFLLLATFVSWLSKKPLVWHPARTSLLIGGEVGVHQALTAATNIGLSPVPVNLLYWMLMIVLTTILIKWVVEAFVDLGEATYNAYRLLRRRNRR